MAVTQQGDRMQDDGVRDTALMARAAQVGARARASGALRDMASRCLEIEDGGLHYQLRILERLPPRPPGGMPVPRDPFKPWDPALYVQHMAPRHVLLLNKYRVVPDHLLIVTEDCEPQEAPLTEADLLPVAHLLSEVDGLAFFNGGTVAGSSQPHRHLQLVPRDALADTGDLPFEAVILGGLLDGRTQAPELPFVHAIAGVDSLRPAELVATCHRLQTAIGIDPQPASDRCAAWNWLMTRRWMMAVPRLHADWQGIEVNALGFAGALLARSAGDAERLLRAGPAKVLAFVSGKGP